MTEISSSPERYTFGGQNSEFETPNKYQLRLRENPTEWKKDNLEYDLRSTDWILEKARLSENYAQHLYAALCNNEFIKSEVWPILKDQRWSCSWRSAGGIIADMRQQGDYIDWYCSGMRGGLDYNDKGKDGTVTEGTVTEEIKDDLKKLGWLVVDEQL